MLTRSSSNGLVSKFRTATSVQLAALTHVRYSTSQSAVVSLVYGGVVVVTVSGRTTALVVRTWACPITSWVGVQAVEEVQEVVAAVEEEEGGGLYLRPGLPLGILLFFRFVRVFLLCLLVEGVLL